MPNNKTFDVKGLSAWAIKSIYNLAQKSGHYSDTQAVSKAFYEVLEDERNSMPVHAECCGCSCGKCSHQGDGGNKHTSLCIEAWHWQQRKFKIKYA